VDALKNLRVGVIGAGIRGRMFADTIAGTPGAEFIGFVDPVIHAGTKILIRGSESVVFPQAGDLFRSTDVDAVVIATPDFLHADLVVESARHGAAILLEKPIATTEEDTERIRAAVVESGVYCMVAFENRWNTAFVKIHDLVASGAAGKPVFQAARLSNTYWVPTKMLSWASQSSPLWFLLPHTVDLVQWVAGSRIAKVTAVGTRGLLAARGIDTWDVVHVIATLEDGSTAALTSAWVLPEGHPAPVDFTYEFVGEKQSAFTDVGRNGVQFYGSAHRTEGILDGVFDGSNSAAPAWMTRRFLADLREGRSPETPLADGIAVNEVLFAIERSLQTGLPQAVHRR